MRAKAGVDLSTLRPEIRRLEPIIDRVHAEFGVRAIVTSANDSVHGRLPNRVSYHYADAAIDLRVKHVGGAKRQATLYAALVAEIERAYPGAYDVLLEHPGGLQAHIHIEPSPMLASAVGLAPQPMEVG